MEDHSNLPDINQLSILIAVVLLTYAVVPFVSIPPLVWSFRAFGVTFDLNFAFQSMVSILAAGLAAVGTDWLLRNHPFLEDNNLITHAILPAFTAWVIGIPLSVIEGNTQWWVIFAFGGVLLILVFVAEFIVVDLSDARHPLATVALTAVSFALFFFLAIAVKGAHVRLFLALPLLSVAMFLVGVRTLYLRSLGKWLFGWSIALAFIVSQITVGFHYLPISPVQFGLFLLGPAYALTSIASGVEEGREWQNLWAEPLVVIILVMVLGIFIGRI